VRISGFESLGVPTPTEKDKWAHTWFHTIYKLLLEVVTAINGNLTFGDGTSIDNVSGKWITYTTNAAPDTEDAVAHNLGVIPPGFIVMIPPNAGFLYKGTTAWTTANIYLKCSAAAKQVTIFVLTRPRTI
jgi:hypothetical protein